jgi:hypothetical protein
MRCRYGGRFWVYALYNACTTSSVILASRRARILSDSRSRVVRLEAGITTVIRCSTFLGNAISRVFQDETPEDKRAIQPL